MVLSLVIIIVVALMPLLISLLLLRRIKRRWQARLRRINARYVEHHVSPNPLLTAREGGIEFNDYFLGDTNCRFNARSPYLRCAVNPEGPCENCSLYEPRDREPKV